MEMGTPKMNNTQRFLDRWHKMWGEALDHAQKNKLKLMLDGSGMILFFIYKDEVYGAPEGSRVTFAKMMDEEDEDNTPGWKSEANFMAQNLTKLGQGQQVQMIFSEKDLPLIDVITKEEAFEQLEEFFEKEADETE